MIGEIVLRSDGIRQSTAAQQKIVEEIARLREPYSTPSNDIGIYDIADSVD